ncbi:NADH:ubiquinone oxidoreductase subunit K [Staphylococcus hominis]
MNDNKLTYILLLIASVFLILNGIFAFEKSIIMVLLSFFFIIIGLLLGFVAIHYLLKTKKEEHQCSSFFTC